MVKSNHLYFTASFVVHSQLDLSSMVQAQKPNLKLVCQMFNTKFTCTSHRLAIDSHRSAMSNALEVIEIFPPDRRTDDNPILANTLKMVVVKQGQHLLCCRFKRTATNENHELNTFIHTFNPWTFSSKIRTKKRKEYFGIGEIEQAAFPFWNMPLRKCIHM